MLFTAALSIFVIIHGGFEARAERPPVMGSPQRVIGCKNDNDAIDPRRLAEGQQGMMDERTPGQRKVLLGQSGAEAGTAAGCGHDCEMSRHGVISVKEELYPSTS